MFHILELLEERKSMRELCHLKPKDLLAKIRNQAKNFRDKKFSVNPNHLSQKPFEVKDSFKPTIPDNQIDLFKKRVQEKLCLACGKEPFSKNHVCSAKDFYKQAAKAFRKTDVFKQLKENSGMKLGSRDIESKPNKSLVKPKPPLLNIGLSTDCFKGILKQSESSKMGVNVLVRPDTQNGLSGYQALIFQSYYEKLNQFQACPPRIEEAANDVKTVITGGGPCPVNSYCEAYLWFSREKPFRVRIGIIDSEVQIDGLILSANCCSK